MYLSEKAGGKGGKGKGAINNRESVLGRPERKLRVEEVVRIQLPLDLAERVVIFRLVVVLRPDLGVVQVELALAARPNARYLSIALLNFSKTARIRAGRLVPSFYV